MSDSVCSDEKTIMMCIYLRKLDEGTKDIKRLNNSLQTNEQERVKREKMLNNDIDTMNNELEILREKIKEKDSNISQ